MVGYIRGKILVKGEDFLIVDVGGVGYKVFVSKETLKKTGKKKSEIELFVWPHLKRTTIELYGCLSQKEFRIFETLEGLPGIGPKIALSLVSFGSLEKLKKAIEKKDDRLKQIKGVGQKRLQRLMVELTGKIGNLKEKKKSFPDEDEVFQGLVELGFSKKEAQTALSQIPETIKDPEKRLKKALKNLSKK